MSNPSETRVTIYFSCPYCRLDSWAFEALCLARHLWLRDHGMAAIGPSLVEQVYQGDEHHERWQYDVIFLSR